MCEKCEERFQALDPKVLMTLDQFTPEVVELLDRLAKELPHSLVGVTMGSFNTQTGESIEMAFDELPTEVQEQYRGIPERYSRNIAGCLMVSYLAFRFCKDGEENLMMAIAMPQASNEGSMMGQLTNKHLQMLKDNGGLN